MASPTLGIDPIRPKERFSRIQGQVEKSLLKQKERDHQWEDQIDVRCAWHHRGGLTDVGLEPVSTASNPLSTSPIQIHTKRGCSAVAIALCGFLRRKRSPA